MIDKTKSDLQLGWYEKDLKINMLVYEKFGSFALKRQTLCIITSFEPRSKKTGLRGFQPGLTQTGLYSHRRRLDA